MLAEIITIGDEILIGQITDTNSAWLGQELSQLGIRVIHRASVSDQKAHISRALHDARQRAKLVIITGGLGPTKDDVTKHTMAEYFNSPLVMNEEVLQWVTHIFTSRNLPMVDENKNQALVPAICQVLMNRNGTAPGMWFDVDGVVFVSLPGVPFEMKALFEQEVKPRLQKRFELPVIIHHTMQTVGIGESFLARKIEQWEDALPDYIKLAYLPAIGAVRLRLSAYGSDAGQLQAEVNEQVKQLYALAGEYIYADGEVSLQQAVGQLLKQRGETLATAESCTGGYLSHLITTVPGSSAYYTGSVIAYANAVKQQELGVSSEMLASAGAVSEAVVKQMAETVRKKFDTSWGIATSGIAGPDGGTAEKPVGTVWIAVAGANETIARVYNMGDNRERTIHRTALTALDTLRRMMQNLPVK